MWLHTIRQKTSGIRNEFDPVWMVNYAEGSEHPRIRLHILQDKDSKNLRLHMLEKEIRPVGPGQQTTENRLKYSGRQQQRNMFAFFCSYYESIAQEYLRSKNETLKGMALCRQELSLIKRFAIITLCATRNFLKESFFPGGLGVARPPQNQDIRGAVFLPIFFVLLRFVQNLNGALWSYWNHHRHHHHHHQPLPILMDKVLHIDVGQLTIWWSNRRLVTPNIFVREGSCKRKTFLKTSTCKGL